MDTEWKKGKYKSSLLKKAARAMMVVMLATLAFTMSTEPAAAGTAPPAYSTSSYTCTGNQADDIVEIALTQEGYTGVYQDGKKYSAYGDWYTGSTAASGAWCAMFVSWCADKAGISTSIVPKTATSYDYKTSGIGIYHDKNGYTPKRGDLVLYHYSTGADRPINHVGIVREDAEYKDGVLTILTIEGNVQNKETNNKGKVCRLERHSNTPNDRYKYIVGFVTPKYNTIVTYNANRGSGAPDKQTKTYDEPITLSTKEPTRIGYTFKGWATSASASTPSYSPGSSYSENAKLTLYACWERNTATIKYSANSVLNTPSSQTKKYGEGVSLSSIVPLRDGYSFKGWSTDSKATTVSYSSGAWFNDDSALLSSSGAVINLYAVWEKNQDPSNDNNGGNYNGTGDSGTNTGEGNPNNDNTVNSSSDNNKQSIITEAAKSTASVYIKGTRLTKVKKGKRKATLSWKRTKGVAGYQIQYSTKKNFAYDSTVKKIRGAKKVKAKIRKLKAKRKYYVRIRTYKIIGGQVFYSKWSKTKSFKSR